MFLFAGVCRGLGQRIMQSNTTTLKQKWRECMSTAKEELTRIVQAQPDDSSPEEIVRELAFHVMIERGLADLDAERTLSNEDMARRIRTWQK